MRCMKTKTTHGDKDPNPRNKYNLAPETARVGYKYGNYIWGVTTLHHYEKISSRDLGLKELRVLRTEVILAFPGSFTVGMVRPLDFEKFD